VHLAIIGRDGPGDRARVVAGDSEISTGKDRGNARSNNGSKRNAVVALFAVAGGSQDRVVRHVGQLDATVSLASVGGPQSRIHFYRIEGRLHACQRFIDFIQEDFVRHAVLGGKVAIRV
jgi:hypothetical protein